MKRTITFLMVFFLVLSFNGLLLANDDSSEKPPLKDILGDLLCIRPVGAIEIAFNSLFFVISLPVTIPLKKANEAEEFLIKDPYNFYFNRGLGEPLEKM